MVTGKTIKRITNYALAVFIIPVLVLLSFSVRADTVLPVVHVGVVYDGPAKILKNDLSVLQKEVHELTSGEFDVRFEEDTIINGNWDKSNITTGVSRLLEDKGVDIVICLGVMSSAEISGYKELPKPAIASSVLNDVGQGILKNGDRSGVPNLNYIISGGDIAENIRLFLEIKSFKRLGIIVDQHVLEAVPGFESIYENIGPEFGIDIDFIVAGKTGASVLASMPETIDALMLMPLLSFSENELALLIEGVNKKKLPGFSVLGKGDVERGLFAGLKHGVESMRLVRRIALNVQRILLGENPENFSTDFSEDKKIVINMKTVRDIDCYPGWDVLSRAELIHEETENPKRQLTISSVLREVLNKNPEVAAGRSMVAAGSQDVKKARSYLIPKLDVETTGLVIDDNSANHSFGTESEKKWSGSVTATQVLFSEKAWSGWTSIKHVQASRVEELETIKLNLSFDAAKAYLNVLRAQTLERILKTNLNLTRANLSRAKMRQSVGTAGASEVYRWESEIAKQKKQVLGAEAGVRQAKNGLNRVLARPLSEDFSLEEMTLKSPVIFISDSRFLNLAGTPEKFKSFTDFFVMEGLAASPELKGLGSALKAGERMVVSAGRAYWLPDVALRGNVTDVFKRGGDYEVDSERDKTAWSVAVNASFPLFSGGAKSADYVKAKEETQKMYSQRQDVAARIEERIRYTIQQAKASYMGIALSRDAADAAGKNLEIVTDAYARGVLSIIELLDAQNAAMKAELGADNSVYNFLLDMMGVQRAIGNIDFSATNNAREMLYKKLEKYMEGEGHHRLLQR